jgi:hypothetical protein
MGLAGRAAVAARRAASGGAHLACRALLSAWQSAPPAARRFGLVFAVVKHGASHLWLVNLGVNVYAALWSVRFWASTDAVAICQALPASGGGDPARTIRVARLVLARALNDLAQLQARMRGLAKQRLHAGACGCTPPCGAPVKVAVQARPLPPLRLTRRIEPRATEMPTCCTGPGGPAAAAD